MNESIDNYYVIFKEWTFEPNQWSIIFGGIGIFLTLIGFGLAFYLYWIQRRDNSKEAFDFFQSSLPQLKTAITDTITNLETFIKKLETDNFENPVLSISLNDNFLNKLNLLDLNRFFKQKKRVN